MGATSPFDSSCGLLLATFRPSFGAVARALLPIFGLICAIGLPLALYKGREPSELAVGLGAAALATAALAPVLGLLLQPLSIQVYNDGIVGRSFWGKKTLLRWPEIAGFKTDDSSGLRLLVVYAADGSAPVWTRPDVIEDEAFQRLALNLAPGDCPLLIQTGLRG